MQLAITDPISSKFQPRSQGLSSYRSLERARRDPGLVWSRATLTIDSIREGSPVIRQFVALSFVVLRPPLTPMLTIAVGLKFRIVSIPASIQRSGKSVSRQFAVVVMLLPVRTHWIYAKSVIFQLWTSSGAILFRSDSYFSTVGSPLNARDQTHLRKEKHKKRPLEKRAAFSE